MNLPAFSLKRPVTVLMSFLTILLVGWIAVYRLPLALLPDTISFPSLRVYVPFPNSTPQETERRVTIPVEEILRTVRNVREMESRSSEGGASIGLSFESETDMDLAYMEVRDRLERIKPDLPESIKQTYIWRFQPTDIPIFWIGVEFDGDIEDTYWPMENRIRKAIQRIDGVANVDVSGLIQEIIAIRLDIAKLQAYQVPAIGVINLLQSENFNVSGGTLEEGGQKLFVRSIGQYRSIEEIRDIPVKGTNLRLADIASVESEFPIQEYLYRINGRLALGLTVYKESKGNTVQVCKAVHEALDELRADPRLRQFRFLVFFDQSEDILRSLNNLKESGMWGGLFAVLVLLFFLRHVRTTLVVALSIPSSVMATFVFMYFYGMSLNIISMMGIMIAIGMLVDNAVVVVENIIRRRQMGEEAEVAAVSGASQVGLAIVSGTLTSVIVFLPLMFSEGTMGDYLFEIGLPISVALLSSLLIALTVIPLTAMFFIRNHRPSTGWLLPWIEQVYGRMVGWTLRNRLSTSLLVLAVLFGALGVLPSRLNYSGDPGSDEREVNIIMRMPPYFTLSNCNDVAKSVEQYLDKNRAAFEIENTSTFFRSTFGRVQVFLKKGDDVKRTTKEIKEEIRKNMPKFPGVEIRFDWHERQGTATGTARIKLYGKDTDTLLLYAEEAKRRMAAIPGVFDVGIDEEDATDEIHLTVDQIAAEQYGLSPMAVAQTLSFGIRGQRLRSYKHTEGETEVWIMFADEATANLEELGNLPLATTKGTVVPLSSLAKYSRGKGLGTLQREDGKTVMTIKGNTELESQSELVAGIREQFKDFEMPQGYSWSMGRDMTSYEGEMGDSFRTLGLSTVLVFLLMGALFESLLQPLIIILSVPLALPGVYLLMYSTGTVFDITAWIGTVVLVGIVVNNSIVLVDHINQLRREGVERDEAIVQAGRDRLRPIIMTAATTILGLVPMALGSKGGGGSVEFYGLGRVVIGGLLSGTLGTLFVIPLIYLFFDEMQRTAFRLIGGVSAVFVRREEVGEGETGR